MEKYIILNDFDNYAVSNYGNIKNIKTKNLLKQNEYNGYLHCHLCQNNNKKSFRVHRLVAFYFIENKECKPDVNHLDGDKDNNHISNLEWCTKSENTIHAQNCNLKFDNREVRAIDSKTGEKMSFFSIGECSVYFNTNKGSIHRVLIGKRNMHKGYYFEYIN